MSPALLSLMKRAYLARIDRLVAAGYTVAEARKAAEMFLPKRKAKAQPARVH
jgi:hypothetical protein